MAYTVYSCAHV